MTKSIVDLKSTSGGIVVDLVEKDKIHVLHVDDDPVFLNAAKQCLEAQGKFQVDTVLSVEEAREKMNGKTYDVIICESVMPGKQGLEFLKELRDSGSNIAFIIFTGKGTEDLAVKALNLGANRYFSKVGCPETAYDELAHGICQVVESKKAEEALRESENYLKMMLDSVFTGLVVIDEETHRIVDANKDALEAIGASREDVVGKVCHRFICPAEKGKCPITDLCQTIDRSERVLLRADGGKVQILKTVTRMTYKNHKYLVDSFVDITNLKKAEHAMLENQEKFRQLFIDNPEPAVYVDPDSRILDINPRFTELFGYSLDEIKGKHINEVVVPDDKMEEASMLDAKSFKGYVYHETVRRRKDGSLIPVSVSIAPITLEGRIIGSVGLYRDITERIRYERSLSGLNAYSRNLNMAKNLEEIYELTLDAAEKILGFEFVNVRILEAEKLRLVAYRGSSGVLSPELPLHADKSIIARSARTGKTILVPDVGKEEAYVEGGFEAQSELAVPIKTREKVLGVLNVEGIKLDAFNDKDSELLEILASHAATAMSNLEHAKNLEAYAREIQESRGKFERLFMDNPEAAVYLDSDFHISDANPRFSELFGYSLDEIKGKRLLDLIVPQDKKDEGEMLDRKAKEAYTYQDTVRERKDGTLVAVSISSAPITVEDQPIGYVGLYRDITDRKHYENSLSALNTYSRNLNMAKSMEEIYELTLNAAEKTLGFRFADILIIEGNILRIVDHRGRSKDLSAELPLDGGRGITVWAAKTGKPVYVPDISKEETYVEFGADILSELAVPIKIGDRVLGVLNVESKKLNAFNEKDRELLEILGSHAATAISNLEYARNLEAYAREIRESQQMFERLFIDNPEAAVYLDSGFHILNVNPRFMRLFGYSLDEIKGHHVNDVIVPKEKMEEAVVFDERASKGEMYHEDTVRKRKDGSLVPVAFSAAPIIVENQVIGHIAVYKDISQLKKAEKELRETLKKLEKTNEKLRVVGGLTRHDARNKLSAITGNVYLAKKNLADNQVLKNLKEMESAVAQMVRIFDFAKTYEMLGVEELRFVDVEKMVNEAVSLFSDLKSVKVINNCHGLMVLADSLLRQLFYNFVDNSLKYGEKLKTITIYYEEIDKDKLKLVYEDDGVGIAESEKKKLFQEGYGRGTGYGLYLIRKMCEDYGWNIQETGKQGEGAQFTITIPKIDQKSEISYRIS